MGRNGCKLRYHLVEQPFQHVEAVALGCAKDLMQLRHKTLLLYSLQLRFTADLHHKSTQLFVCSPVEGELYISLKRNIMHTHTGRNQKESQKVQLYLKRLIKSTQIKNPASNKLLYYGFSGRPLWSESIPQRKPRACFIYSKLTLFIFHNELSREKPLKSWMGISCCVSFIFVFRIFS